MAKISLERWVGGGLPCSVIHPALTRDTAGVLAGRSFTWKTLWLNPLGVTLLSCLHLYLRNKDSKTCKSSYCFLLRHSYARHWQTTWTSTRWSDCCLSFQKHQENKCGSKRRLPRNPDVEKCPRSLYCARVNMFESVVICIKVTVEKCQTTTLCMCSCCTRL